MVMTPLIQPTPMRVSLAPDLTTDSSLLQEIDRRINDLYYNDVALAGNINNVANTATIVSPMAASETDAKIVGAVQSAIGAVNKVDLLEGRMFKLEQRMLAIEQLLHAIANPKEGSW